MNNYENKFGVSQKEEIYKKYEDKYYILNPIGTNNQHVGKIKKINAKTGLITLNPYYGLKYNRKIKKNIYTLIDKDYDLFTELNKLSFEPTTKESIVHNCYLSNEMGAKKSKSLYDRFKLAYKILFKKE